MYLNEINMNIYDLENDKDKEWIELTKLFEDWTMQLLDKVFYIYSSKTETGTVATMETIVMLTTPAFSKMLFMGMGKRIYDLSLEKVFKFISTNMLPDATDYIGSLISFACFPYPEKSVHIFIDYCHKKLIGTNGAPIRLSKEECLWYLGIAKSAVVNMGAALVPLKEKLISIAIAGFSNEHASCTKASGAFLCAVLSALTYTYPLETRPFAEEDMERADFARTHYKEWGKSYSTKSAKIPWHIPREEEVETAGEIFNLFVTTSITQIQEVLDGRYDDLPSPVTLSPTMGSGSPSPTLSSCKKVCAPHLPSLLLERSPDSTGKNQFGASFAYRPPTKFQAKRKETTDGETKETGAPEKKVLKVEKPTSPKTTISSISVSALKTGRAKMPLKNIIVNLLLRLEFALKGSSGFFLNRFMTKEKYLEGLAEAAASGDWRREWVLTPPFPEVSVLFKRPKCVTITPEEVGRFIHETTIKMLDEKKSPYADNHKVITALTNVIGIFVTGYLNESSLEMYSTQSASEVLSSYAKDPLETRSEAYLRAGVVEKAYKKFQSVLHSAWDNVPFTETHDLMIKDLMSLSLNPFSAIRELAQAYLGKTFNRFSYQARSYFNSLFTVLENPEAKDYQVTGTVYLIAQPDVKHKIISHSQYLCKYLCGTVTSLGTQPERVQNRLFNLFYNFGNEYWEISAVPLSCLPSDTMKGFIAAFDNADTMPLLTEEKIALINSRKEVESKLKMDAIDETVKAMNEAFTKGTVPKVFFTVITRSLTLMSTIRGYSPSKTMVDIALKCSVSSIPDVNSTGWNLLANIMYFLKGIIKEKREKDIKMCGTPSKFKYMSKKELDIDYYSLPVPSSEKEWNEADFADKCNLPLIYTNNNIDSLFI